MVSVQSESVENRSISIKLLSLRHCTCFAKRRSVIIVCFPRIVFREKFGDHIPHLRREDVKGFVHRKPVWLIRPLGLEVVREQASAMEVEARRFYEKAAARAHDAQVRELLDDLAQEERSHQDRA